MRTTVALRVRTDVARAALVQRAPAVCTARAPVCISGHALQCGSLDGVQDAARSRRPHTYAPAVVVDEARAH